MGHAVVTRSALSFLGHNDVCRIRLTIRRGRAVVAEGPVAFLDGRVYTLLQGDFKEMLAIRRVPHISVEH